MRRPPVTNSGGGSRTAGKSTAVSLHALHKGSAPNHFGRGGVRSRRDDLVVQAVIVQATRPRSREKRPPSPASWVGSEHEHPDARAPRRQVTAVLKRDDAARLAAGLHEVVDRIVRSTSTPAVRLSGNWSWTCTPLLDEDLLVAEVRADMTAVVSLPGHRAYGWTSPARRCTVSRQKTSRPGARGRPLCSSPRPGARQQLAKGRTVGARTRARRVLRVPEGHAVDSLRTITCSNPAHPLLSSKTNQGCLCRTTLSPLQFRNRRSGRDARTFHGVDRDERRRGCQHGRCSHRAG